MVDFCEKCKYYYIGSKKIKGNDDSIDFITQNNCKLHHRIAKNKDGVFVPLTNGYVCEDFNPK